MCAFEQCFQHHLYLKSRIDHEIRHCCDYIGIRNIIDEFHIDLFAEPIGSIESGFRISTGSFITKNDIINIIFSYKEPGGNTKPGFNTAYWFCGKIYMEFVYYVPNPDVVTAMANFMVDTTFEVKMVLKALLESAHFYDVNVQNAQLKSPVNFMASLIREYGLTYLT